MWFFNHPFLSVWGAAILLGLVFAFFGVWLAKRRFRSQFLNLVYEVHGLFCGAVIANSIWNLDCWLHRIPVDHFPPNPGFDAFAGTCAVAAYAAVIIFFDDDDRRKRWKKKASDAVKKLVAKVEEAAKGLVPPMPTPQPGLVPIPVRN